MPRCGCQGNPRMYWAGVSPRKSSISKKGSNSLVSPNPKARLSCTPAPSSVGLLFNTLRIFLVRVMTASRMNIIVRLERKYLVLWESPWLTPKSGDLPQCRIMSLIESRISSTASIFGVTLHGVRLVADAAFPYFDGDAQPFSRDYYFAGWCWRGWWLG